MQYINNVVYRSKAKVTKFHKAVHKMSISDELVIMLYSNMAVMLHSQSITY